MKKQNYLFSTTRQWNPGDEFILFGLINLLEDAGHSFNPIIYNRNPDVRDNFTFLNPLKRFVLDFRGQGIVNSFVRSGFKDNSFKNYTNPAIVDKVYFAGSPEWQTYRLEELYRLIDKYSVPVEFHGIGAWKNFSLKDLRPIVRKVMKGANAITVRDEYTESVLRDFVSCKYISCPALYSSRLVKKVTRVNKVALIFSTYKTIRGNKISKDTFYKLVAFYKELLSSNSKMSFSFVCHYIDEIEHCRELFPDQELHYSYDAKDYQNIYNEFDFVIGCRVHGVGISASQGIPGILISHDARGGTGKGFGVDVISVDSLNVNDLICKIESDLYISETIENIGKIKKDSHSYYMGLLKPKESPQK